MLLRSILRQASKAGKASKGGKGSTEGEVSKEGKKAKEKLTAKGGKVKCVDTSGEEAGSSYLDQLPSPEGSWNVQYKALQTRYNVHLVMGVGVFLLTIGFGFGFDLLQSAYIMPDMPAEAETEEKPEEKDGKKK